MLSTRSSQSTDIHTTAPQQVLYLLSDCRGQGMLLRTFFQLPDLFSLSCVQMCVCALCVSDKTICALLPGQINPSSDLSSVLAHSLVPPAILDVGPIEWILLLLINFDHSESSLYLFSFAALEMSCSSVAIPAFGSLSIRVLESSPRCLAWIFTNDCKTQIRSCVRLCSSDSSSMAISNLL